MKHLEDIGFITENGDCFDGLIELDGSIFRIWKAGQAEINRERGQYYLLLMDAITTLHWRHGIGDVTLIDLHQKKVTSNGWGMPPQTRKFRFEGRTVHYLGHQITFEESNVSR